MGVGMMIGAGVFITIGQTATLALVAFLGIGVAIGDPTRFKNFSPFLSDSGWMGILPTMGFVYVAFEGFEVIAQAGDETIDPKRNLPKAMMLSVVIVAITYMFVTIASVLAEKTAIPLVMVKARTPVESLVNRWV